MDVENRLLRKLVHLPTAEREQWLLELDDRIDSNRSTTLELEDHDGLSRRERAEISVRFCLALAHAPVQLEFEPEIRSLTSELLGIRRCLFSDSLRLVLHYVKIHGEGLEFSTAVLQGALGLDTAIDRFDPDRGFQFSTYATWWVRQHIQRSRLNYARAIRLPVHATERIYRYWRTQQELWAETGERPEALAVLAQADVDGTLEKIGELRRPTLVARLGTSDLNGLAETVLDADVPTPITGAPPCPWVDGGYRWFERCLEGRPTQTIDGQTNPKHERDVAVIRARLGIGVPSAVTLQGLGELWSVTRERIRQIETKALGRFERRLFDGSEYSPPWLWDAEK